MFPLAGTSAQGVIDGDCEIDCVISVKILETSAIILSESTWWMLSQQEWNYGKLLSFTVK